MEAVYIKIMEENESDIKLEISGTGEQLMHILVSTFLEEKDIYNLFSFAIEQTDLIKLQKEAEEAENENSTTLDQNL